MIEENFDFNGYSYQTRYSLESDEIHLSIKHDKAYPNYLYKYYSLNSYSIHSFLNNYLFSSHPYQLNDKYDCSSELVDYSNCDINFFLNKLNRDIHVFEKEFIISKFNSDSKWELERAVGNLERDRLYMKFGIISLTQNERDILMWAYYAQNSGFIVKFKTELFNKDWFGPFPINYIDSLSKIDFTNYSPLMSFFYQANVKHSIWIKEDEWRYITYNINGDFLPYFKKSNIRTRYSFYNPLAIEKVIIGYDFFEPDRIKRNSDHDILKLRTRQRNYKLQRSLLNYLVSRNIKVGQILRHNDDFVFGVRDLNLTKLGSNTYKMEFGDTVEIDKKL